IPLLFEYRLQLDGKINETTLFYCLCKCKKKVPYKLIVLCTNSISLIFNQHYDYRIFVGFQCRNIKYEFLFFKQILFLIIQMSFYTETNRTPFDFAEGESELVSGFNVEYRRGGFALIFLSRISLILIIMEISYDCGCAFLVFYLKLSFIYFMFVWVRGTLPQYRYRKFFYLEYRTYHNTLYFSIFNLDIWISVSSIS
ncbi:hypothetical protein L9F63_021184, partial [Diploptera punctata]